MPVFFRRWTLARCRREPRGIRPFLFRRPPAPARARRSVARGAEVGGGACQPRRTLCETGGPGGTSYGFRRLKPWLVLRESNQVAGSDNLAKIEDWIPCCPSSDVPCSRCHGPRTQDPPRQCTDLPQGDLVASSGGLWKQRSQFFMHGPDNPRIDSPVFQSTSGRTDGSLQSTLVKLCLSLAVFSTV